MSSLYRTLKWVLLLPLMIGFDGCAENQSEDAHKTNKLKDGQLKDTLSEGCAMCLPEHKEAEETKMVSKGFFE